MPIKDHLIKHRFAEIFSAVDVLRQLPDSFLTGRTSAHFAMLVLLLAMTFKSAGAEDTTDDDAQYDAAQIALYRAGNDAVKRTSACEMFRPLMENGHAAATYTLASCFANGDLQQEGNDTSEELYLLAIERGSQAAKTGLGLHYLHDYPDSDRDADGNRYLMMVSEKDDRNGIASFHLGISYLAGRGIHASKEQAVEHLLTAITKGNLLALASLSHLACEQIVVLEEIDCEMLWSRYTTLRQMTQSGKNHPTREDVIDYMLKRGLLVLPQANATN